MSVNLKITLGTVNYTDFIHVTAAKVSQPSIVLWEDWITMPVTNYNFVIPDLDPENYYVSFYDAPTSSSVGTLQSQMIVNAFTGDTLLERRFYTVDGGRDVDPAEGDLSITDPYLIGKTISGFFKEGFRYYEGGIEYEFDSLTGKIDILTDVTLSSAEKVVIEIIYKQTAITSGGGAGLYDGTITVTEPARSLLASEINARIRLNGSATTQVITLPLLDSFSTDKGFYFDNTIGGTPVQVKLLTAGSDKIFFSGFNTGNNYFDEFWVSVGEHLLLRKYGDNWEIIGDYKGISVGEKVTLGYKNHPGILYEMGQQIDGDKYPRLWWWINNVLPLTHKYTRGIGGTIDPDRRGQFSLHTTEKKFWMPFTVYMTERGLHNFDVPGSGDPSRLIPYPGGFQSGQVGDHKHNIKYHWENERGGSSSPNLGTVSFLKPNQKGGNLYNETGITESNGINNENRVENVGVIYARRI
jgi:hypothetical protein